MSQISKTTADRGKITRTITSTVDANSQEAGSAFEKLLFPNGVPPNLTAEDVLIAISGVLGRRYQTLEAADIERASETQDDDALRDLRDSLVPETRDQVMAIESIVEAHWGERGVGAVGLEGNTPRSPDHLLHYGRNVSSKLARLDNMDTRLSVNPPPLDQLADELDDLLDELAGVIDDLQIDVRETENARAERNRALDEWDETYSPVASIVENIFRLAELEAQAERVRPTSRRRSGRPEPEDLDEDDESTSDDPSTPTDEDADDPIVEPI